jgi:hypothetical protein
MIAQIQVRRGTTAEWAAASPVVLEAGELGYDTTLKRLKVGDGSTEWAALPALMGSIDVLTADPTGADLYDGRIWVKSLAEAVEIDTLAQAGAVTSGAAIFDTTPTLMVSLNYMPTADILVSKISILFLTDAIANHTAGNDIRVRICADDGTGKPDTAVVYGTATITGCPATNATQFTGTATFATRILLSVGVRYHFVCDVPTGTGKSFYRTYIKESQPTDDEMSFNAYVGPWSELYEAYTPSYKIYIIE